MTNPCCDNCACGGCDLRHCHTPTCPCHKSAEKEDEPTSRFLPARYREPVKELEFPTDTAGKPLPLDDCSGCSDPRSEGTHAMHTKQHPCREGGDPNCGHCFPTDTSELSKFIREASPEEKKRVWLEIAKQASADQRAAMADTSEEWKGRFDNTFDFVRGEMNEWEQIHYDHLKAFIEKELEHTKQRSFEEGMKRRDNEAQLNFEKGHAAGFEEGVQFGRALEETETEAPGSFKSGHAAALSKVKELIALKIKKHQAYETMSGDNGKRQQEHTIAALTDLLDHLKTIE